MLDEIKSYLEKYDRRARVRRLIAKPEYVGFLQELYPEVEDAKEVAFLFVNGYERRPTCVVCDGRVNWLINRYSVTCSGRCNHINRGVDYHNRISQILREDAKARNKKSSDTCLKLYGTKVHPNTIAALNKSVRESDHAAKQFKIKATLSSRYGVTNALAVPGAKEKQRITLKNNMALLKKTNTERREHLFRARCCQTETMLAMIDPDPTFGEANYRLQIQCSVCEDIYELPTETFKFRMRKLGLSCAKCSGISTSRSIMEKEVADYVSSIVNATIFNDCITIRPKELDIFIPDLKVGIEFCGLYWHSELVGKDRWYHRQKLDLCKAKGISLITIFEDEWINRRSLVESILCAKLGKITNTLNARSLTVGQISSKEGNAFTEANHLQGRGRAKLYYGLFNGDLLVSVMSFSDSEVSRRSTGWDINRFCTLPNTTVRGGAGKLFKAFVRAHDPETVISYADLRYGDGQVYAQLGFVLDGPTVPNYWYFKPNDMRRYHRFGLRKNAQDVQSLTEWENRIDQGWNRIWDCGHNKWIWNK